MLANTPQPRPCKAPTYTRSVFEAILAGMGWDDAVESQYICSDDGARVKLVESAESLAWHPYCEIMAPGSPNPLDEPWLKFPFTARQLAALMVEGWGRSIQEAYGDWDDGPNKDDLQRISLLGGKATEALSAAYAAYRDAVEMAPRLDSTLEETARELTEQYDVAREAANIATAMPNTRRDLRGSIMRLHISSNPCAMHVEPRTWPTNGGAGPWCSTSCCPSKT